MNNNAERTLTRLFAEADITVAGSEPFVAAVSRRIALRRRAGTLMRIAGSLGAIAVAAGAPLVAGPATSIALLPGLLAEPLEAALLSPAGWVAGLLLSGLFVWRGSA